MRWAKLATLGVVAVLVTALAYPRIHRSWNEESLKGVCDRSIQKRHDRALKDYALAMEQYEAEISAYGPAKQQYDRAHADFAKAKEAYQAERSRALLSGEFKKLRKLIEPREPESPMPPRRVAEPEDAASLPSISWMAVVSLETKATVLDNEPASTCVQYINALLADPDKAAPERWEIELALGERRSGSTGPDLMGVEDKLSEIRSGLSDVASEISTLGITLAH